MGNNKKNLSKKNKASSADFTEDGPHSALINLGTALIESLEECRQNDLEVFELYTHGLKTRIHVNEKEFCSRIIRGYDALLATLESAHKA